MEYTLKELLDVPRLRELLDALDELHSMPSAIIDTEGNVLTATAWQDICTKFHRVNSNTEKMCIESDRHIEARLGERQPHVIYKCPMGLVDSAMPIIIDGRHIGNVFTGQLFMETPEEAYFINQARTYGFDEAEYLEALRKVPLFSEEKLHKNLNFIHSLTQMLAEQGLQNRRLQKSEKQNILRSNTLEMLAKDEPLPAILTSIVSSIEHEDHEIICSILLLDQEGKHLRTGSSPSLPDFYNEAIDGIEIGLGVGSCGTAAYTGERVIVSDITTHPYWAPYKEVAAKAGLGSCWSEPIRSSLGKILGTFAIYHREARSPSETDLLTIEHSSSLVSLAIEKKYSAEELLANAEQHRTILYTALSGFWLLDEQGRFKEGVFRRICG